MIKISGDYQYRALHNGPAPQCLWHYNKLNFTKCLGIDFKNLKIVDVGCGSGNFLFEYKNHFKYGIGIDINYEAISFIRERIKRERVNNVDTMARDMLKDKIILKEQVDAAVCLDFLEHFKEGVIGDTVIPKIRELIRKGGFLIVTVPNRVSYWPLLERMLDFLKLVPALGKEQHLTSFDKKTLSKLLIKEGFSIKHIGTFNHVSPFLFSKKFAELFLPVEVKYLKALGPLIFVIARKED